MKCDLVRQNIANNRYNLIMVVATKIEVQIRQHQFCRGQFRANATGIFGADFFVSDMATTRAYDLMGRRFERLLVVERAGSTANRMALWRCVCDCGGEKTTTTRNLTSGAAKSCGCYHKERSAEACRARLLKHGHTAGGNSRTYRIWANMVSRCTNEKFDSYPYYGGRGIVVCDRWREFTLFLEDMGEAPAGMSIDRVDSNGPYALENCRWASKTQQANNHRGNVILNIDSESMTVAQWALRDGAAPAKTIYDRIARGWGHKDAVFAPKRR